MIDPEVTAWCPRGDHADSGLLRRRGSRKRPGPSKGGGPRLATTHPPPPQNVMTETTLSKKKRAFDDEVVLTVAPFYLIHMLQRTLPAGFVPSHQNRETAIRQRWAARDQA